MSAEIQDNQVRADTEPPVPSSPAWVRYMEVLVALGTGVMGAVILIETQNIRLPRGFTAVGPRDFPRIIGVLLIVVGIWYVIDVVRSKPAAPSMESEDADPTLPADWSVLAQLAVVLVLYAVLMRPAGFIIASAALFFGTAISMGSRHVIRDAVLGAVLAIGIYLMFSDWLGIRLPKGILDGIL